MAPLLSTASALLLEGSSPHTSLAHNPNVMASSSTITDREREYAEHAVGPTNASARSGQQQMCSATHSPRRCSRLLLVLLALSQAAYRQERLELLQDVTTLAQDAAMNFSSLNDNLDRLIGLVSLRAAAVACPGARLLQRSTLAMAPFASGVSSLSLGRRVSCSQTQSVAATRPTWQALARSTFGQHAPVDGAESKQS